MIVVAAPCLTGREVLSIWDLVNILTKDFVREKRVERKRSFSPWF